MTVKTIELEDGKYTVSHDNGSDFHALRHGEKWRDLTGDGLALAMVHKIDDCQEQAQRNLNRAIDAETELRKAKELFKELLTGEPEFYPSAIYPDPRGGPDLHEWALKVREFMRAES